MLATKLYIPSPQPTTVLRSRLIERLIEGLQRKLTLISAPAGFGKTTVVSEWVAGCERPVAWLSLDEGDSEPTRFLEYLIAALQTIAPQIGHGALGVLQSPQPPPIESTLTALLNDIATVPDPFILVLDDYHLVDAQPVDEALTFLIEHQPPNMHVIITTREDPRLPLARLRVRGQLTELRAADLRFTPVEVTAFLKQSMGLNLSEADIAALETRTEGWIAGLQLAAISMRGQDDASGFITSFTGSHRFVLDYLVEEVLQQQPESIQTFLLRTSILDRLSGSLCDALLLDSSIPGRETLEYLERANLFIVPLDNERRWYRYHHLFAELLRQRLHQMTDASTANAGSAVAELHLRASAWFENNDLELEAFHHAIAANDVERAARLIDGNGMPLAFRGGVAPVLNWLESLPTTVLDAWPSLWTTYASVLLVTGKTAGVEQKLEAAETALQAMAPDDTIRDRLGRNAAVWATLAANLKQIDAIIAHSQRSLEYLSPGNLAFRTSTIWKLGYAYHLQGKRAEAGRAFADVVSASQASGNTIYEIMATIGLARVQEAENHLHLADQNYRRALQMLEEQPLPISGDAQLGLARVCYEWNDLEAACQYGQQSLQFARQRDNDDRRITCNLFLASLRRAQGDLAGAAALVDEAARFAHEHNSMFFVAQVAAAQVRVLLDQGQLAEAMRLAQTHGLAISQARVHLSAGDPPAALAVLEPWRRRVEANGWEDERLRAIVLQSVAQHAHGDIDTALQLLSEALALAEPGGFIRVFVDEGPSMAHLLSAAIARAIRPDYARKLLTTFEAEGQANRGTVLPPPAQPLIEPLSQRELEVLRLIAQGLSNRQISDRLFLALNTVKGHNRVIFGKLQVQRRTEAVARARELDLI
ncbi:MAG TPA: LuxR C-terminal-related transcriptional regulator [Thermomicrobiales bacterium]|nr:LuxR C-terminal-related transcriptional regulator [Thermomicrobiales bacterium]